MSIQTQIQALETDKTNIRQAILDKGGTCAEGNGFDDFATDIATIQGGGGSLEIVEGDFTPTEDVGNFTITHNKGKRPFLSHAKCTTPSDLPTYSTSECLLANEFHNNATSDSQIGAPPCMAYSIKNSAGNLIQGTTYANNANKSDISTSIVKFGSYSTGFNYRAGYTYHYKLYFI